MKLFISQGMRGKTDEDIDFLLDKMQEMEKNYGNVEDNT